MSNHVAVKFLSFNFSEITPDSFSKNIQSVIESLRKSFPRFRIQRLNEIEINFGQENLNANNNSRDGMLQMLDAEGLFGIKVDYKSINVSVAKYVQFSELLQKFEKIMDVITTKLEISHYSSISLRNINLFDQLENTDCFEDIQNSSIWGTHDFNTLFSNNFTCQGAATRHEYIKEDGMTALQISSAILFKKHSYIPGNEWDIWKFRGEIPTANPAKDVQLLIDIMCSKYTAALNSPEKNNVGEYEWRRVKEDIEQMHNLINGAYQDIVKE